MENNSARQKKVLLDGDVISHFIKGELVDLLPKLFPNRLILLNIVKTEIYKRPGWNIIIDNLIKTHVIEEVDFPEEIEFVKEYAHMISGSGLALGKGESACMVYCRFNKEILASSNLKDIQRYCSYHSIEYITTADIIYEAHKRELVTEVECDTFISKVKSRGSKFPYDTMKELLSNYN